MPILAVQTASDLRVRRAGPDDLARLLLLEDRAFRADSMPRRSLRRFLRTAHASMLVADCAGDLVGHALLLFRARCTVARLYSLAVAPDRCGVGIGRLLMAAAEHEARRRGCRRVRLEVHERNGPAIALYQRAGYQLFGLHRRYYQDNGNALRFEKALSAR
jgi:ribosomal protein S18 acetylase RimI-like enzyme